MSLSWFKITLKAPVQYRLLAASLLACAAAAAPTAGVRATEVANLVDLLGWIAASRRAEPPAVEEDPEPIIVGRLATYRTSHDDTLADVALRFNLGYVSLVAANPGIDPWVPGEGTEIVLPLAHLLPDAPREGIVINLPEMRLYFFDKDGGVQTYPLGVGREGLETPRGTTEIKRKAENPIWYPTAATRADDPELPAAVPPGEDNPLGTRALYLGWPAYLIHGTNRPYGIGRRTSRGCIRMYTEDVERLYPQVPVGTKVTVIDQPIKLGWSRGELYLEAHPTKAQADQLEINGAFDFELPDGLIERINAAAGQEANRLDWATVRQAALERRGYPVKITR
jgi:L,D-transpeptidase ErfK/SrfK